MKKPATSESALNAIGAGGTLHASLIAFDTEPAAFMKNKKNAKRLRHKACQAITRTAVDLFKSDPVLWWRDVRPVIVAELKALDGSQHEMGPTELSVFVGALGGWMSQNLPEEKYHAFLAWLKTEQEKLQKKAS
jgi:hypothetical protein